MNSFTNESHQREVLEALTSRVSKNLSLLAKPENKSWWPEQFFQFMDNADYAERLSAIREEALALTDDLLVVLVGDMITEEALPNYSARLASMFPDTTGISENPWSIWQRGWSAEEDQHGSVLHTYLLLTGRVNMSSIGRTIFQLIANGFQQEPSLYKGLFYPAFQEVATYTSHLNVSKISWKLGVKTCTEICANIAADEKRHSKFYIDISKGLFEIDPDIAMLEYASLIESGITMPAERMECSSHSSTKLFASFSEAASNLGVYSAYDYASILEKLNSAVGVGGLQLQGEAARAQEAMLRLPERVRRVAARQRRTHASSAHNSWLISPN